jgi:hypothetical protein
MSQQQNQQTARSSVQAPRRFVDALRKAAQARAREIGDQSSADLSVRIAASSDWRERS